MMAGCIARVATVGVLIAAFASLSPTEPVMAASQGDIVLTVTGDIETGTSDSVAQFDLDMLQQMRSVSFSTNTDWTEGVSEFAGVPLFEVLSQLGVTGGQITARAINDYAVTIEFDEINADYPIIAYFRDGELMSVREKGPLWIIFPYDLDGAYRTERVYSQSIWQLDQLEVAR